MIISIDQKDQTKTAFTFENEKILADLADSYTFFSHHHYEKCIYPCSCKKLSLLLILELRWVFFTTKEKLKKWMVHREVFRSVYHIKSLLKLLISLCPLLTNFKTYLLQQNVKWRLKQVISAMVYCSSSNMLRVGTA